MTVRYAEGTYGSVLLIDADSLVYRIAANPQVKTLEGQQHILHETIDIMADRTKATDAIFFLTGRNCFRKNVPVPKLNKDGTFEVVQYKGNRKDMVPPETLNDLREYLVGNFPDTFVSNHIEADDMISYTVSALHNNNTHGYKLLPYIVVAIDKDLLQIKGVHFNWVKAQFELVTDIDAERFLKYQLLCGDRTDNVPGLPGIGDARANKMLTENPGLDIFSVYQQYYKPIQQPALWHTRTRSLIELLTPGTSTLLLSPYLSKEEYDNVMLELHKVYNLLIKKIQDINFTLPIDAECRV